MAMWETRTSTYKVGIGMLLLSSAIYITGFASPFWIYIKSSSYSLYFGLWEMCQESSETTRCAGLAEGSDADFSSKTAWFRLTQAAQCLGLIFTAAACVYAVVANVRQSPQPHSRLLEFFTAASGMSGIIGCMIFIGHLLSSVHSEMEEEAMLKYLSWSFGLSVTGCILFFINTVVIVVGNRPDRASTGMVVQPPAEAPVAVSMQGFPSDPGHLAQPVYGYDQGGSTFSHGRYAPAAVPPQAGYGASGGYGRLESASHQYPK